MAVAIVDHKDDSVPVDYSQNGEQAEILHIFDVIGIEKGHLVDIGAGDGVTMSNSRALLDNGWTGDLYDGDPKGAKDVKREWITKEIAPFLVPPTCDFLSIDIDGNDWHILRYILIFHKENEIGPRPSLIVAEFNPIFDRHEAKVMPYNGAHTWNNDTYYGCSLAALENLAKEFGYTLAMTHAGINAFLLRNDHAKAHPELIRPIEYKQKWDHPRHNPELPWVTL
jgi:hypothetical protein